MTDGVAPQSSWILSPAAPAASCSSSGARPEQLPLPRKPMLIGRLSNDRSISSRFQSPEVIVVPFVPSVGPMPPPNKVVTPLLSAVYACCGEMRCTCASMPAAVRIRCSPEMASVAAPTVSPGLTPSIVPGLPALPIPTILPSLTPTSAFTTPRTASTMVTLVITRSSAPPAAVSWLSRPMPSRSVLPPP